MKRAAATLLVSSLLATEGAFAQESDLPEPPDEAQSDDAPPPRERKDEEGDEEERLERDLDEWQEEGRERTPKRRRRRRERADDYDDHYDRPRGPGYHQHDGLYLHLGLGIGWLEATSTYQGDEYKTRGVATGLDVELGGAPVRDFVIFGKLGFTNVDEVELQVDGVSVPTFGAFSLGMLTLGGGAAFYLRQVNLKLSAALGLAKMVLHAESDSIDDGATDWGPLLQLGIAKEWWVGHNWGIGGSAKLSIGEIPERNQSLDPWNVVTFLIGFSSTFN